jgi:hypothetical protein
LAFARHQFELSQPQQDGATLLTHLLAVWEKTDRVPSKLANAPTLPEGLLSLWTAFGELHSSRGSTGLGCARITFADMVYWQAMTGGRLDSWQVEMIRRADDIWLADFQPKPKEGAK